MSLSRGSGSGIDGSNVTVPTISVTGGGDDGIVLGLGLKQLAVAGAVGAVALVVVIGAVAAGTFFFLSDGNDADLDLVPQGANSIAYVNVDQATSDQAVREVVDTWYELEPSDTDSMADAMAEFENETGLDPDDLHHATSFSKYDESTGMGASDNTATILRSDWSEEDVTAAVERDNSVTLVETSYNGVTVYEPDEETFGPSSSWIAVLGEGTYVVGTEAAVTDTVDVHQGDVAAIDGELREAFEDTRSGYLQFAFELPEEQIPSGAGQVDTSKLRDVTMVTGAYYTTSNSLGVEMTMHTTSESAAMDVQDVTEGGVSLLRGTTENEELKETLRDVEVTREGTEVTVSYENSVESITELLRAIDEQSGDDQRASVQAGASVSAGDDRQTIDVTWTSNGNAEYLAVEFASEEGPDDYVQLTEVGESYTYEGESGTEVAVTVTAVGEETSTVIVEKTISL